MKSRAPTLCAALPLLALWACGDPRKDLVGNYDATGSITFTYSNGQKETDKVDVPLIIVADAFDSDALYLDFDCGMSGKLDDTGFVLNQKVCPSYETSNNCTLVWTFTNGGGSKEEALHSRSIQEGNIKGRCADRSSGGISFFFTLTGTPTSGPRETRARRTRDEMPCAPPSIKRSNGPCTPGKRLLQGLMPVMGVVMQPGALGSLQQRASASTLCL